MQIIYVIFVYFLLLTRAVRMLNNNNTTHIMKIKYSNYRIINSENKLKVLNQFSNKTRENIYIKRTFFPPDLRRIFSALEVLPNSVCRNDSISVLRAVARHETWALKMFDSSPKFPVGMLFGSYYQLGNYDECVSIKKLIKQKNKTIQGQYCLADVALTSNNKHYVHFHQHGPSPRIAHNNTLRWAICVPSTCRANQIEEFLDQLFKIAITYKAISVKIPKFRCHIEKEIPFTLLELFYGAVVSVFLASTTLATLYHLIYLYHKTRSCHYNINVRKRKRSKLYRNIILSFSLIQNIKKLLTVTSSDLNLNCLSGIKFLSMGFIITSHTLLFLMSGPVTNEVFNAEAVLKSQNAILINNPLLVDTFLLISGFLMSRLLLLQLEKRNGKINVLLLYLARYVRLTPAYLIVIGLYCTFLKRLGDGPLWDERILTEQTRCLKSWWTNLLYINNYVNTDSICMFQSWYLSVDTHLFILAPGIIYPLWKWPKFGRTLLFFTSFLVAFIPFAVTCLYKLDPTLMVYPAEMWDITVNYYYVFAYIKTHMRAISYFIGLVAGYIVHKIQSSNIKLSRCVVCLNWILATILGLSSVFSITLFYLPDHQYNRYESAAYSSLHKVAWSTSIAWVIISCVTENSESVRKFLSWTPFVFLSRITYSAYLVNGIFALYSYSVLREPTYLSIYTLGSTALSHLIITFAAGFVLSVLFESPILSLEKCFVKREQPEKAHYASETFK